MAGHRTKHQARAAEIDRNLGLLIREAIASGYREVDDAETDPMAPHWRSVSLRLSEARGVLWEKLMHPDDVAEANN